MVAGAARWLLWAFATAAFAASPPPPGFRLPGNVVPLKYKAELSIDPGKDSFEGTVLVTLDIEKPTSTIWLNGKDLELKTASLIRGDEKREARVRAVNKELIQVDTARPVSGSWTLQLAYAAKLDEKAVIGAYRRKLDGEWYAYTTFTPIEARRAIPCFDELRFKTPWQISITVPRGQKAFSNAPEVNEEPAPDGQVRVDFAETKPLPSELVAFAVGPFDIYQGKPAGHNTPVRAITPQGEAEEGRDAAETTVSVLPRLEEYTGIPYQFGKLDHLAMADAGFGAVENPGLIVYLAREMLMIPGSETNSRIHGLHLLEAHELGHQWFGDLVTQATWADVWLSEGFATWISEKIVDQEDKPERAHLGLIEARERIMLVDASRRTRPVRVEVHDREGSRDIYDRIAYDKGASVLLMLEGWLGEEKFREGLRLYLQDYRFANASTADLAAELKRASGVDPAAVMHSFLDGTGVPRVSAEIDCAGAARRLKLRQSGSSAIPVCYRGPGISGSCTVLDGPSREVDLPASASCPTWIQPNAGGTGYYRTSWTAELLETLPLDQLTPAERLTLAYDLTAAVTDKVAARQVLRKLANDREPEVARAAQDALTPASGPRQK